jgi:hypothetical protein
MNKKNVAWLMGVALITQLTPAAIAQNTDRPIKPPESIPISPVVLKNAKEVRLSGVGRRASDGVIVVDPEAIRGKILIDDLTAAKRGKPKSSTVICIGYYSPPECYGILVDVR